MEARASRSVPGLVSFIIAVVVVWPVVLDSEGRHRFLRNRITMEPCSSIQRHKSRIAVQNPRVLLARRPKKPGELVLVIGVGVGVDLVDRIDGVGLFGEVQGGNVFQGSGVELAQGVEDEVVDVVG